MYKPFEGGSEIKIQGVTAYLPPVGYVPNYYNGTGELIESEILFEDTKKWSPDFDFDYYKVLRAKEERLKQSNPEYKEEELSIIKKREWERRLNGVWVYIKDQYVYLTGAYYFYLSYWFIDSRNKRGLPSFRIIDWEKAIFWQHCIENPKCLGILEATVRRVGKTAFASCATYEFISRQKNKQLGIQSKTDTDAKKVVYEKALVSAIKYLPDFFIPMYDEEKGLTSKSGLSFNITRKKGVDDMWAAETEINSHVLVEDADPMAFDGQKLHRVIHDEVGKLRKHNVYERHMVLRKCCMDTGTGEYIGKMIATTTVEEIDKGGANFEQYWNSSNQYRIGETGETQSGLYRFFTPAYRTMHFDEYGFPDEERARKELNAKLKSLKGNPMAYNRERRESPMSELDLFASDAEQCPFNVEVIDKTINYIEFLEDNSIERERLFDMVWEVTPEQGQPKVKLSPNPLGGRWRFSYVPEEKYTNCIKFQGSGDRKFHAMNEGMFAMGTDPVSSGNEALHGKSKAAIAVYMKETAWSPPIYNNNFIATYTYDPNDPEEYYDDCLKACIFFGIQVLIEKQKMDIRHYFKRRGALSLVMERPENTFVPGKERLEEGIAATSDTINLYITRLCTFFDNRGANCRSLELLKCARLFNYKNRTERDLTVAAGWTILAAEKPYVKQLKRVDMTKIIRGMGR